MKTLKKFSLLCVLAACCTLNSCEDFLEIEAPRDKMISEIVFDNDETALSAMQGIYNQLLKNSLSSGGPNSVTILAGLSADDLTMIRTTASPYLQFDDHDILVNNSRNSNLWDGAYNTIYLANSLLEGIENSSNISDEVYTRLKGEASFVRAFTHFYLVNLYGDVPLVLTTDYQENARVSRINNDDVYQQILTDLQTAEALLKDTYSSGERTQINRFTAVAMLARVHLYLENWEEAEELSSEVIANSGTYEILEDLNKVFLANSREAIWQISTEAHGYSRTHTNEGSLLTVNPDDPLDTQFGLDAAFVSSMDKQDKRYLHWVGYNETLESHFVHKYKVRYSTTFPIEEYSMVLRLPEQYLIRAEAKAMLGDLDGAIADIDVLRARAGIELLSEATDSYSKEELLDLILKERKWELFAEWGHRWLDLKRTERSGFIFSNQSPNWQETDILYPIPEAEMMKNKNLTQNPGY